MPGYYDDDDRDDKRAHRRDRDRPKSSRRERPPVYEEEEIIEARRGPARDRDPRDPKAGALIPRPRDSSESSIEDIPRDYIPSGGHGRRRRDYDPPRRARSHGGGRYDDYDEYGDRPRKRDGRRDRRRGYSSSSFSSSPSPRRKPERRKSLGEQALAALGIGSAAGAVAGKHDRDRERDRDRRGGRRRRDSSYSSDSRSRSRERAGLDPAQLRKAAKAALAAGAAEAFRSRKEPGGWAGPKGKRVLTAAIGAGGIDGLLQSGNKDGKPGGTMQTIESVIGGLAGNRLINGKRDKSGSRSRSRSRGGRGRDDDRGSGGGGGLAGLAAGGLAAAAGKALMDRSKSKDRDRGRRHSSSDDDRGGGRGKRSKSVTDYARQGMAALGIGGDKGRDSHGSRRGYDDDYAPRPRGGGGEGGDGISSVPGSQSSSEDDISSSEEDRERKKMGHKQLITAGLASVATIHAGQSVYKSIEGRRQHAKKVAKGQMSPEEARKMKNKARLQDAAAIGIAALGIKGAYSEWKEMKEQRDEAHEFDLKRAERHARRQQRAIDAQKYGHMIAYGEGHDQYRASAPNLTTAGAYPMAQSGIPDGGTYAGGPSVYSDGGGYYGDPPAPHYTDGNPYHTGGVPPPSIGTQPARY